MATILSVTLNDPGLSGWDAWDGTLNGTPVIFEANQIFSGMSCIRIDDTHALIAWRDNIDSISEARVAIISGTSISYGTAGTFVNAKASRICLKQLSATSYVIVYVSGTNDLRAKIITLSGTSLSFGSELLIDSGNCTQIGCDVTDSTHVVIGYLEDTAGFAIAVSISGTTLTAGTRVQVGSGNSLQFGVVALDSSRISIAYKVTSGGTSAETRVLSLTGTTLTVNAAINLTSGGDDCSHINGVLVDTDKVLYVYENVTNSNFPYATIVTISGTTPTIQTQIEIEAVDSKLNPVDAVDLIDTSTAIMIYRDNTNDVGKSTVINIDGNALTARTPVTFEVDIADENTLAFLEADHVFAAYENDTDVDSFGVVFSIV